MSRYSKIDRRMWHDAAFMSLSSAPPNAQTLFVYLLTGPHCTSIPGIFVAGQAGMAEALGWEPEAFRLAFREVLSLGMAEADTKRRLVWLPKSTKYNQPESLNVVKSWKHPWEEIPECDLKVKAYEHLKAFTHDISEAFGQVFLESCDKPSLKARRIQEQEQEPEPEQDRIPVASGNGAKSATPKRTRKKPGKPGWTSEAIDDWVTRFGGCTKQGEIGKHLKPLIGKYTWEVVRPVWREYLNQDDDAKFLSPAHFAGKYLHWAGKSPKPERKIRDLSNYDPAEASKKAREDSERRFGKVKT